MLICSALCQNVVLRRFHTSKELKITGSQVREVDDVWSNTSHRKRFRSLFVAAAVCGRALSWRRTIPEDNIPRRLSEIKESNYSTHSAFGGRLSFLVCLRTQYALKTEKCDVWRSMGTLVTLRNTHEQRNLLILTVFIISRPIGPWKNNSPLINVNCDN